MSDWKKVGEVPVDSGQMMLCDPCYLKDWVHEESWDGENEEFKNKFSYNGASQKTLSENVGVIGKLAAVSSTGWGDGSYPVYVVEMSGGHRIAAMMVVFDLQEVDEITVECESCGRPADNYDELTFSNKFGGMICESCAGDERMQETEEESTS